MISFEKACEIAERELLEEESIGISQIRESDEFWIFLGWYEEVRYGTSALGIRKETGECGYLAIHSPDYWEIFRNLPIYEVPCKYRKFGGKMKEITKNIVFNEHVATLTMKSDAKIEKISEKERVLEYLKAFDMDAVCAGKVYDMVKKEYTDITIVTYSDGEYYWDSSVIYYFENYDIELETEFVCKVMKC